MGIIGPGKPEGAAPSAAPTHTSQQGQDLIKHFEGCCLNAYPDPASGGDPWTCGFGHTGPDVVPGLSVTQAVANQWLRDDLERFEKAVVELITVPLDQAEFDALVSFSYNCGTGALADSTLRRRLNAGEDKATGLRRGATEMDKRRDGRLSSSGVMQKCASPTTSSFPLARLSFYGAGARIAGIVDASRACARLRRRHCRRTPPLVVGISN